MVAAAIIRFLGLNNSKSVVVVRGIRVRTRKWKLLIVASWVAIIAGFYMVSTYGPQGGLEDPKANLGINLIGYGVLAELFGEFMLWWHRN